MSERKLPGRKAGKMTVKVPGPAGSESQEVDVEIRLDVKRGVMLCEINGEVHEAATVDDLKKDVAAAIAAEQNITWERYIIIKYSAKLERWWDSPDAWYGGGNMVECGLNPPWRNFHEKKRATPPPEGTPCHSIALEWTIIELSSTFVPAGESTPKRLERHVKKDGTAEVNARPDRRPAELPEGTVLCTPERIAALQQIRARLTLLSEKMRELFAGDPEERAARLDNASALRQLTGG